MFYFKIAKHTAEYRATKIHVLAFLVGALSVYAQTFAVREILSRFGANELLLAFILFCWLIWGAFGSFSKIIILKRIAVLYIFSLIFSKLIIDFFFIFFVDFSIYNKNAFFSISAAIILTFPAFFAGKLFASLSRTLKPNVIYALEAVGASCGGAFTMFNLTIANSDIIFILMCTIAFLSIFNVVKKNHLPIVVAFLMSLIAIIYTPHLKACLIKNDYSYSLKKNFTISSGKIEIWQTNTDISLLYNGHLVTSSADSVESEKILLPIMWNAGDSNSIMLINGWQNASISHLTRFHPKRICLPVESFDLLEVAQTQFAQINAELANEHVVIIKQSPVNYLHTTIDSFDIIICFSSLPLRISEMGTWSEDFFANSAQKLSKTGIFAVTFPIAINAPTDFEIELLQTVYGYATKHFNTVEVFWVDAHALAVASNMDSFSFAQTLTENNENRLYGKILTEKNLPILFNRERNAWLHHMASLERKSTLPVFFAGFAQQALFMFPQFNFRTITNAIKYLSVIPLLLFFMFFLILLRGKRNAHLDIYVIAAVGFSGLFLQVLCTELIALSFGNLYGIIGLTSAIFMAGSALGSLCFTASNSNHKTLIFAPTALLAIALTASIFYEKSALLFIVIFCTGFTSGIFFAFFSAQKPEKAKTIYAADLFGSAVAALFMFSLFLWYKIVILFIFIFALAVYATHKLASKQG